MADIVKINGAAAADIAKIEGAASADVVKINGNSAAAPAASYWVAALQEGNVAWAASGSLSGSGNWTEYDNVSGTGHPRAFDIGYGKNASGNGIYVLSRDSSTKELGVSGDDVTTTHDWANVNLAGTIDQYFVRWAVSSSASPQGVWMTGGASLGKLWRSIDGAQTFSQVVPPAMTGENIMAVVSDGAGNWAFGNDNKFYFSDDDGASFVSSTPWASGGTPGYHRGLVYTNNSWTVIYSRTSTIYARSCAASDITDWGSEFRPTITYNSATADGSGTPDTTKYPLNPSENHFKANAEGVAGLICMTTNGDKGVFVFSVSGKTITNSSASSGVGGKYFDSDGTYEGVPGWQDSNTTQAITTDGAAWALACKNGDVYMSEDNGASWIIIVNGFSVDDWNGITAPVIFPL